jgi:hypothetical protein
MRDAREGREVREQLEMRGEQVIKVGEMEEQAMQKKLEE